MKKKLNVLFIVLFFIAGISVRAQTPEEIAKGINFIETQTYSAEENAELLKMYEGLRVADVSDGMDMVGLPNTGLGKS
jgi:4-hydroxy-4-methyl-2-oxoglutarate aldolase